MTRSAFWLIPVLPLVLLTGCAQQRIANEDELGNKAALKAESFIGDARNALDDAEEAFNRAKAEDLEFFTPLHWQQINDAIKTARKEEVAGHDQATITASALVTTLLNNAMGFKDKISDRLASLLTQRQVLLDIRADKVLAKEFTKQDNRIRELASQLEAGKEKDINPEINDILSDMTELERNTMLELHWRPAQKTLEKAEDEGVDDFAPVTYAAAEKLAKKAFDTISAQYIKRDDCARIGHEALRAAQHALYIGRDAEKIVNLDPDDAEQATLRTEDYLQQIGEAIGVESLRYMSLQDQTLAITQRAREMNNRLQKQIAADPEAAAAQALEKSLNSETREEETSANTSETDTPAADSPQD